MAKKLLTNEQRIKKLLASQDTLLNALLCERIQLIAQITEKSINEEPDKWKNGIIHPSLYLSLCANIKTILGDEQPEQQPKKPAYRERYFDNNGPTGHGDICMSDADPGL